MFSLEIERESGNDSSSNDDSESEVEEVTATALQGHVAPYSVPVNQVRGNHLVKTLAPHLQHPATVFHEGAC
jgi:hypothetical protein